jgi:hypothetical protein
MGSRPLRPGVLEVDAVHCIDTKLVPVPDVRAYEGPATPRSILQGVAWRAERA